MGLGEKEKVTKLWWVHSGKAWEAGIEDLALDGLSWDKEDTLEAEAILMARQGMRIAGAEEP